MSIHNPEQHALNQAQLLAGVLNSSLDGIMAFRAMRDDAGQVRDFIFEVVNQRAAQMIGRLAHDLIGKRLLDEMPGNQADGLFDAYVRVVETGQPYVTELHYQHDGLDHWFSIRATRCGDGFAVSFADITAQVAANDRFRVLFECSTDAHLLYNDNGIIDCNQAAADMLGYDDKRELLNIHPASLSPEYQPCGLTSLEKKNRLEAYIRDHGALRFDWVHLRKDNSEITLEVTVNPVELSGGHAMLVVWHDLTPRLEAEAQLREAAERLNEAQRLANIGSWQWTPTDNRILWSAQTKRIFGVPLDQPEPDFESHQQQIHPDDLPHWRAVVEQSLHDHEPYAMRFRAVLPDGEIRVIEGRGQTETAPEGAVTRMFGTVQDISEQYEARDQLNKLSMVAARTMDGVVITDAGGRVEWINPAFTRISGYTLDDMRGRKPGEVLQGPGTDPLVIARIREGLSKHEGFRETLLNYHKDGTPYWIECEVQPLRNDAGEVVNFMAIERDVTRQLHQKREIEEQRQRLEFALDASQTGLWDWHIDTGQTYLSNSWYTMLGYAPGELPMCLDSWIQITEPGDMKLARAAIDAYFRGETDRYACEMRLRNKAGQWQWILDIGEAIERDDDGRVLRMIGLHVDIHRQKLAQIESERARDLAQQASAAKSAFVANMSHEIRTPMNAILGFADLLLDPDQTEADKRNHVVTIQRNGRHLMSLLNDVLDISKIEAGKMSIESVACAPDQLFADVITMMMPQAMAKDIDLTFEAAGPLPARVLTDPTRVRQVLINLVGNAIKFTEEGSVRVVVRQDDAGDDKTRLTCEVIDTGIGIEPGQIDQLFKPFSQADESMTRRFGGTGLGLAISHNLCTMLGGELRCDSTPGQGTTFTASFLVTSVDKRAERPRGDTKPTSNPPDHLVDRRVLVVEDGPDNQRLIKHFLTKTGAHVEVREHGELGREAALAAERAGRPFDVVLMDMQMPVLDGYEATRQLRAAGYDRPIIALTAHSSPADRQACLDAGCTDYLAKPVDRHKLIQTISQYVFAYVEDGGGI